MANNPITLHLGDCLDVLKTLPDNSVDAIVTDPPYGLEFLGNGWDSFKGEEWRSGAGMTKPGIGERDTAWPSFGGGDTANATCATCGGRMRGAKKCTCDEPDWCVKGSPVDRNARIKSMRAFGAWCEEWAREALRVVKPGGHIAAFGGTRTYHRLTVGLEDAGWEIRDTVGVGDPRHRGCVALRVWVPKVTFSPQSGSVLGRFQVWLSTMRLHGHRRWTH